MKRLLKPSLILGLILSGTMVYAQFNYVKDSISMTPTYAEDVFYSLSGGVAGSSLRANWDIAFRANTTSASILVNDGAGAELYAWPNGAIADWANVDTIGMSTWPILYNSPTEWEEGAFTRNATGHPDYGWGVYNQVTHNLAGDSIFIIKTITGALKKIAIVSKQSLANIYTIHYANLDGSMDTTVSVNAAPYNTKNFIYFDLGTNMEIDREPLSEDWDIQFTKYADEVAPGSYYLVTGVLQNYDVRAARYTMGDTSSVYWELDSLKFERNTVGWDWKAFSMSTFMYEVDDSMYFFVQDLEGDLYKIVFESFVGSSTGDVTFRKGIVSPSAISDHTSVMEINVFPNPVSGQATVRIAEGFEAGRLVVYTRDGRKAMEMAVEGNEVMLDTDKLAAGLYFIEISGNTTKAVSKLIVR